MNIKNEPYSLRMMVNFFIYIFFILANAIQFGNNSLFVTFSITFIPRDYIFFQLIIFLILIIYNGFYTLIKGTLYNNTKNPYINPKKLLFLASFSFIFILVYYNFNPYQLLFRGFADEMAIEAGSSSSLASSGSSASLIFNNFIRPIPWGCFLIAYILRYPKKYKAILFFFTLITAFPTGMARTGAAFYWIPIMIVVFGKYIKGYSFIYFLFFAIIIIFPFLNNFRRFNGSVELNNGLDYLNSMNFDASQNFMALIKSNIISNGYQLLGVFFFFIPRSVWPSKPSGSGYFLVEMMNGSFFNVSMPYFGEGFINFGFIGILIFTIILAIVSKKLDSFYWNNNKLYLINFIYYYIVLASIIFIMRGDLLSSWAYTIGRCISIWFIIKFCSLKLKIKLR